MSTLKTFDIASWPETKTPLLSPDELWVELQRLEADIDHHESDLYVVATKEVLELVKRYRFRDGVTHFYAEGKKYPTPESVRWLSIPFAYKPFWDERERARSVR